MNSKELAFACAAAADEAKATNIAVYDLCGTSSITDFAIVCTATTAVLWLIPAGFFSAALATSGMGFGYGEAWFLEEFFVGAMGFFQPFQNAWVGLLLAMTIQFCFHYFCRLYAHRCWHASRIRR